MREISRGAHETRSAGTAGSAVRPLAQEDIDWADVVAVMETRHVAFITERWPAAAPKLRLLGIDDRYHRGDLALRSVLESRLRELLRERKVV